MLMDSLDEAVYTSKTEIMVYNAIAGREPHKTTLQRKLARIFNGEDPGDKSDFYLAAKFIETFPEMIESGEVENFLDGLKKYPNLPRKEKDEVKSRLTNMYLSAHEDFICAASKPCMIPDRKCT